MRNEEKSLRKTARTALDQVGAGGDGAAAKAAPQEVVYSEIDDYLVFIPKELAAELWACHQALRSSKTWRELRARISAAEYRKLIEPMDDAADFQAYARERLENDPGLTLDEVRSEYLDLPIGERLPEDDDPFSQDDVPWTYDGDWPEWPAQEMLDWVPASIQEQYGSIEPSHLSGECLTFDPDDEDRLLFAFRRLGYRCMRDDELVRRSSGYEV
jgi:hypothetical protein